MVFVTPLFAAIFGLMYLVLSFGVIKYRSKEQVSIGSGDSQELKTAIRIHGNFAEYVPLCLILLFLLENLTLSSNLAFWMGVLLFISRVCHVIGMRSEQLLTFRVAGMLGTFAVILISSLAILWIYLPVSI